MCIRDRVNIGKASDVGVERRVHGLDITVVVVVRTARDTFFNARGGAVVSITTVGNADV